MQVHWQQKCLAIPFHGQTVILQGIDEELPPQLLLQVSPVSGSASESVDH